LGYFDFDIGKRQAEEEVRAVTSKKQKVDEVAAKQKVLKLFQCVDPVFVCYCNVIDLCHVIDMYLLTFEDNICWELILQGARI
jgi:hypothetical protein